MVGARGATSIGFAEVPEFHVALVRQRHPEWHDRPIVVGGDPAKRGKVVAASAVLQARGVAEGMHVAEVLDREPEAQWVRTDIRLAREASGRLRAAVREVVEALETEGLASFYLRMPRERQAAVDLAERLASRVATRTGLPLRVGIAPVRFAARLAAQDAGRDSVRVVEPDEFEAYLLGLPIERLPGVGPKTAARLAELGARDVAGLRALGQDRLELLLGNHGRVLGQLAGGDDPRPLRVRRRPDTLSREETLEDADEAGRERERIEASLRRLAENLEAALRRDGLQAARIALRLTGPDDRTRTRSCTLPAAATRADELTRAARGLLERTVPEIDRTRRVGLVLKGLEAAGRDDRQLDLFASIGPGASPEVGSESD